MRNNNLSHQSSAAQGTGAATRCVHPALHFEPGFACVGIVDARNNFGQVTSDRKFLTNVTLKTHTLQPEPLFHSGIAGRWSQDRLDRWLNGEPGPTFADTLTTLTGVLDSHMEFRHPEEPLVVGCWIVATYFYPLFPAFPRLHLQGEKGSGKSKLLEIVSHTAFNGLLRLNPTPATLFRLIDPLRPTLCLDEMESLLTTEHREINGILNNGYRGGGSIDRCEGKDFQLRTFAVYAPIALAGISGVNSITLDRCISLVMERGHDRAKINHVVDRENTVFGHIRDQSYRLALSRFPDIPPARDGLSVPDWLKGRHRELYMPLITIGALAENDGLSGVIEALLATAERECGDRNVLSDDLDAAIGIWRTLLNGSDAVSVRPKEFAKKMEEETRVKWTSARAGQMLRRYGFERNRVSHGTVYELTRQQVEKLCL